jgi:hypothetical protein
MDLGLTSSEEQGKQVGHANKIELRQNRQKQHTLLITSKNSQYAHILYALEIYTPPEYIKTTENRPDPMISSL